MSDRTIGGWVYVIQLGGHGPIKIGYASDVAKRVADLQAGSPVEYELLASFPGDVMLERSVHAAFSDVKVRSEWFAACPDVLDRIVCGIVARQKREVAILTGRCTLCGLPERDRLMRGGICFRCYQRDRRGHAVAGESCAMCGLRDARMLRRCMLADGLAVLCANHAAVAGKRRPSISQLREWCDVAH